MALFTAVNADPVEAQTEASDVELLSADDKEFEKKTSSLLGTKEELEPEPKEETIPEVEEKEISEEETEEPTEEDLDKEPEKLVGLQSKLETKYPGISKEFPNLRNIIYSEKAFREIYPTVKEAREVRDLAGQMKDFETSVSAGNSELLLHSIKSGVSQEALETFAHNFLPTLQRIDKPTHFKVVNNIVKELLRHVDKLADEKIAQKSEYGEDLKHSVAHITNALYNSVKIPDAEAPPRVSSNDSKLTNNISNDFINSTAQRGQELAIDVIEDSIKSLKLTPFQKRNLGREIYEELEGALETDQRYRSLMKSLWDRALAGIKSGRLPDERARILHTLRERVKDILPAIRAKKLAEILPNDRQVENTTKSIPATKGTKIGGKEQLTTDLIRKNKMSDMDIILHGAGE